MGKFTESFCLDLKKVEHPVLKKPLYVPVDYEFYQNGAEKEKFRKTVYWLIRISEQRRKRPEGSVVLDAFAGCAFR